MKLVQPRSRSLGLRSQNRKRKIWITSIKKLQSEGARFGAEVRSTSVVRRAALPGMKKNRTLKKRRVRHASHLASPIRAGWTGGADKDYRPKSNPGIVEVRASAKRVPMR